MTGELKPCCDSSHEGNGRPGHGVLSPAVEKLLNAVAHMMDVCEDRGAATNGALALVTRRENQLIDAAAKHDAKVTALRADVERIDKAERVATGLVVELRAEVARLQAELAGVNEGADRAASATATMISIDRRKWQAAAGAWDTLCNNGYVNVDAPPTLIDPIDEYLERHGAAREDAAIREARGK